MKRLNCEEFVRFGLTMGSVALVAVSMSAAQSTTAKPLVKPAPAVAKTTKPAPIAVAAKPAPVAATATKPTPVAATARPAAVKTSSQTAGTLVTPAASRGAMTPTTAGQTVTSTTTSPAPSNFLTNQGVSNPTQQYAGSPQSAGSRSALSTQGLGTFLWGDATLTVYSCYRTGTRVLCDFDFIKQNNSQVNAPWVWGGVNLVDDGGKLTRIHNAYFMGQDGSQFQTGYVSMNPVRMIMEYDDVAPNFNSVALVYGANRIQGVPIVGVDPSQPAGTIPGRGAASTQAAASGAASPIDGASNAVNNATNTVNTTKQKSKSLWDSLKSATSK
jgi:hypothetical protein